MRSTRSCAGWNRATRRFTMLLSIQDLRVAFRLGKTAGVMQRVQAVGRSEGRGEGETASA